MAHLKNRRLGRTRMARAIVGLLAGLVLFHPSTEAQAAEEKRSPLTQRGSALGSGKQLGSGPGLTPEMKAPPAKAAPTPKAPPPSALTPKPGSVMAPGPALTPVKKAPPAKVAPPVKAQPPQTPVTKPGKATAPGPALTPVKQTPPVTVPPQAPKPVDLNSSAVLGGKKLGSVAPPKPAPPVTVPPQTPKPVDLNSSAVLGGKQLGSVAPPKQPPSVNPAPPAPKPVDLNSSEVLGGKQLGSLPEFKHKKLEALDADMARDALPYAFLSNEVYENDSQQFIRNWERIDSENSTVMYKASELGGVTSELMRPGGQFLDSQFNQMVVDPVGFHAAAYRDVDTKRVVVVFEGTTFEGGDWITNFQQIGGIPKQYGMAKEFLEKVARSCLCDPGEMVVTGHSLGGGLAQYAASTAELNGKAGGFAAYAFNSAGLWSGTLSQIEKVNGDTRGIKHIVDKSDLVHISGTLLGDAYFVDGEAYSLRILRNHGIGQILGTLEKLSQIGSGGSEGNPVPRNEVKLRDKARWELARDMIFEGREYKYNVGLKTGDYQLAKSVVDVHGNRVRIEAYVLRPAPNQVQQLVLNAREKRLDYGYWLSTYFRNVSGLEEAKTATRNTFYSRTMPSNYLTRQETFMTNTVDGIRATVVLGAPAALNFGTAVLFYPSTINTTLRLTGPGYDNIKETVALTHNGNQFTYRLQYPNAANVMADYLNLTYTPSTGVCVSCGAIAAAAPTVTRGPTTAPAGGSSTRYTFKNGTFLRLEGWWVTNDGKVSAPPGSASLSGNPNNMLKNLNLEARYTATEFNGRNIDLVVPGEVFSANNSSSRNVSEP